MKYLISFILLIIGAIFKVEILFYVVIVIVLISNYLKVVETKWKLL